MGDTANTASDLDDKVNEALTNIERLVAEAQQHLDKLIGDLQTAVEAFRQARSNEPGGVQGPE